VRGSKKREKSSRRINDCNSPGRSGTSGRVDDRPLISFKNSEDINIFAEIFTEEDDLIWPLQLVDLKDQEQFRVLYPLMFKLPHVVMYYLNEIIFPEVLAHQNLKLSTCGQELGGEMLFGRRIGFSGTPSVVIFIHTYINIHIYIYEYIYIHIYTYIYIYMLFTLHQTTILNSYRILRHT
jgi:hypothetical protein